MSASPVVHLVAKTHLDVGFTAPAADVVVDYVERSLPAALAVAAELRERGGPERLVWTTGSWLVHTFLERADAAGRAAAEAAIGAGDLVWHALPFTTHTELCDVGLVEAGLAISERLDHRFGRRTVAAKLTDVPGHTRGLVPLLAGAGVELLHIGVNPVATVPDVPGCFRWRSPDGREVTVAYQAGGYGDLTEVPGCAEGLAFLPTGDNRGPPSADEVVAAFATLRARRPDAEVRASSLDAFAVAVRPVVADLPVVTAEIGDTWIHGVGSDPGKVAAFRELLRLRRSWADAGMVAPDDSRLRSFHEQLLLVAEHTWGLDEKVHLPDRSRWSRADLPALRAEARTQDYEASWAEQRAYVEAAVRTIDSDGLRRSAQATLSALRSPVPAFAAGELVPGGTRVIVGGWDVEVDGRTGALTHLADRVSGRVLADEDHQLALVAHQAFSEADYQRFWDSYVRSRPEDEWWAVEDTTKPGIDAAGALSAWWEPDEADVHVGERWSSRRGLGRADGGAVEAGPAIRRAEALVVVVRMPEAARTVSGSPPEVVLVLSDTTPPEGPSTLGVELRWEDKPANRLPEATWLGVRPVVADPGAMVLDKLGQDVSPLDVVASGGQHLHAVGDGVRWPGPDGTVILRTLDAPLLAPGRPRLLDPGPERPELDRGVWICLHDNVWGTNFPMWSEGSARFRFELSWTPS